jgi:hypothetical protein
MAISSLRPSARTSISTSTQAYFRNSTGALTNTEFGLSPVPPGDVAPDHAALFLAG